LNSLTEKKGNDPYILLRFLVYRSSSCTMTMMALIYLTHTVSLLHYRKKNINISLTAQTMNSV